MNYSFKATELDLRRLYLWVVQRGQIRKWKRNSPTDNSRIGSFARIGDSSSWYQANQHPHFRAIIRENHVQQAIDETRRFRHFKNPNNSQRGFYKQLLFETFWSSFPFKKIHYYFRNDKLINLVQLLGPTLDTQRCRRQHKGWIWVYSASRIIVLFIRKRPFGRQPNAIFLCKSIHNIFGD